MRREGSLTPLDPVSSPLSGITHPFWDLVGWLSPRLLTLLAHVLLGLWCKEAVNLEKSNEFQVINVGEVEGWWPGAHVLAMLEVRVKLHTGEGGLTAGTFSQSLPE